jgi:A/G-specific adenine glycosylase
MTPFAKPLSSSMTRRDFSARLIDWQTRHGRHDLPWQNSRDPYRIWLAEIMLQQTQVATVIPYYVRFLARFPDVARLAAAPLEDIMTQWSGLGYYARARNLHRTACKVMEDHGGRFPETAQALAELPGIGRSTAAAIAVFASDERAAILDGNVKRILCRAFGIEGFPGERAVEERLWTLAEALLPKRPENMAIYIQAQMDLGATVCTRARPICEHCPLAAECVARISGRLAELPMRRPKKALPRRMSWVAVVVFGKKVLLERRPPAGIWGGLLAFPEIPAETGIQAWVANRFGINEIDAHELPPLTHGFTHFTLEIAPWRIDLPAVPRTLAEPAWQWLELERIAAAALPAPVRKILEKLPECLNPRP